MRIYTQLSAIRDEITVTFMMKHPRNLRKVCYTFPVKFSDIKEAFEKSEDDDLSGMHEYFINDFRESKRFVETKE